MSIFLPHNPYRGINAHANSYMQNKSAEWISFHSIHVVQIMLALNGVLPNGYEARAEYALQVRQYPLDSDGNPADNPVGRPRYPVPDVSIFSEPAARPRPESGSGGGTATAVLEEVELEIDVDEDDDTDILDVEPLIDTMDLPDPGLVAAVIYKIEPDSDLGRPVTRIELLSPTNKPPGLGYEQYRDKRNAALLSGLPLIEIDYLHQQQPPMFGRVRKWQLYPTQKRSYAYSIAINDPRPSASEGHLRVYRFGVDRRIPKFDIPLDEAEKLIAFDLGAVYNTTFASIPTLRRIIDYAQPPQQFELYSAADQKRIQARMQALTVVS